MTPVIHDQLDPVFETGTLLYLCAQGDPQFIRQESVKELNEFGLDGEALYSRYAKVYDKYYRVFAQNQRVEPEEASLLQGGYGVLFMRIIPFLEDPGQLERKSRNARQLAEAVLRACNICFEQQWDIPALLGQTDQSWSGSQRAGELLEWVRQIESLDEADRWRVFELLCDPVPQFTRMAVLIQRNLPAQKKAQQAVAKPLQALLNGLKLDPEHLGKACFSKKPEDVARVWPALSTAFGLLLAGETCYYGLLCDELMRISTGQGEADQMLAARLKALGDKTRLEIMDKLKQHGGSYNAQLAQELGLTPATISHHLDLLLTAGLVEIHQKEKRLYCTVKEQAVEEAAAALRRRFGSPEK